MRWPLALPLLLAVAGCDFVSEVFDDVIDGYTVTLQNDGSSPVHILAPGESFGSGNRLAPGATRTVEFIDGGPGERVRFEIGANGSVFQAITCEVTEQRDRPRVVYGDGGTFCEGW